MDNLDKGKQQVECWDDGIPILTQKWINLFLLWIYDEARHN